MQFLHLFYEKSSAKWHKSAVFQENSLKTAIKPQSNVQVLQKMSSGYMKIENFEKYQLMYRRYVKNVLNVLLHIFLYPVVTSYSYFWANKCLCQKFITAFIYSDLHFSKIITWVSSSWQCPKIKIMLKNRLK